MLKDKKVIMIIAAIVIILAVILCLYLINNRNRVVGKDIKKEDIKEFYYTYATTTADPVYLRYHIYKDTDDIFKLSYEYKSGDINENKVVSLTDKDFEAIYETMTGAKVIKRVEHTETGGSGPWLYLYWTKDNGKIQEFSFETDDKLSCFEDLVNGLIKEK